MNTPTTHYYTEFSSPVGVIELRGTPHGLTGLFMEKHRHGPTPDERAVWNRDDALFSTARTQVEEYFAGTRRVFDVPLDLAAATGTEFQRRVWQALCDIPYGADDLLRRTRAEDWPTGGGACGGSGERTQPGVDHRALPPRSSVRTARSLATAAAWTASAPCWTSKRA